MHVESNKTKTFRPLLLCMINTPHGLSEYTNIWVHPIKTFLWQHILRIPFFYIRPKNRLHFYTPCQVLVINFDKTSSMAKFSWSFVRWAMLQTVNWVILPNGMMQNTLQLIMPQVCHITCSAILPALTLWVSDGCWPLNPCFPHFQTFYAWQTIYFLNLCGNPFNLSLFDRNRTILKIWPPYKRSMTFSYFVLYLDNATSYGYHVIYFFTPYNKRNNMTCITTKLKHFEFSNAWRGVSLSSLEGVCIILFTLYC